MADKPPVKPTVCSVKGISGKASKGLLLLMRNKIKTPLRPLELQYNILQRRQGGRKKREEI